MSFKLRKKGGWGVDYHGPDADHFEASCHQWFEEQKVAGNDLMEFLQGRAEDWVFFECWNARGFEGVEKLSGLVDFLIDEGFELSS